MQLSNLLHDLFGARYTLLLASLVLTCLLSPLANDAQVGKVLTHTCFSIVILTGMLANRQRLWIFRTAVVFACIAVASNWSNFFAVSNNLHRANLAIDILYFAFSAVIILVAVFRDHMASTQAVLGSISVYLLLGLTWALSYLLLESFQENAFFFADRRLDALHVGGVDTTDMGQLIYFSFVTMSTLGYGDIAPRTPIAQTLCWMQAVAGQLFIAIFVARMVSEWKITPVGRDSDSSS